MQYARFKNKSSIKNNTQTKINIKNKIQDPIDDENKRNQKI